MSKAKRDLETKTCSEKGSGFLIYFFYKELFSGWNN